jgi:hypothetical protein
MIAIHLPDNFDPLLVDKATERDIDARSTTRWWPLVLQDAQQYRRTDRAARGDLAESSTGLLLLTLGEQIPSHSLAQHSQRIELLVVKFSSPAHPRVH